MARNNVWMSVSDLMTGLMVIFLFVAIAYIKRVQDNQSVLTQYVENRQDLHDKLVAEFKEEAERGRISIHGDLSMRFENAQTLFAPGSWALTPAFQEELRNYIPRYLGILLNASMKDKIREIRIEGHTDNVPYPQLDADPYYANLILSQRRALNVMQFIRNLPEYQQYSDEDKELLEYWFTANGLSYGRALDDNSEYIHRTKQEINKSKSRRVEFRLITAGEEMLEEFVEKTK
jgi:outer membrane protein OmpA-like peptidoglycan-associated protein